MVLTFLERQSHNSLSENRKRETLDACMRHMGFKSNRNTEFYLKRLTMIKFTTRSNNVVLPFRKEYHLI